MKIGTLARRSGLSAHTLRYYERIGLLPYADRDGSGQRDYDASILNWIEFLGRLKAANMPIREMLRYAELDACLRVLDRKIAFYSEAEERTGNDEPSNENTDAPTGTGT